MMVYKTKQMMIKTVTFCILICLILNGGMVDIINCITSGLYVSAIEPSIISSGNCGKQGENVRFALYDDGTLVISGNGEMMDYEPDINPSPFDLLNKKIKKVIVESNVTSISGFAFYYCDLIETIELSDTVSEIYSSDIGDGIGLFNSKSLKNIHVSENNKTFCSIDGVLFSKEIGKTEFTVNYAINSQRKYKVYNVSENGIFLLEYPAGRTETEYTVPENVVGISSGAFRTNTYLKSILLPDDLVYMGEQAFAGCIWLERIVIPEKVGFLSNGIFAQCLFLKEVYISKNIEAVCWTAFNDCPGLTDIYYGGTQDDWKKIIIDNENSALENAIIHYNYRQHKTQNNEKPDSEAYRIFYNKNNIIPGDTVIVGADKIGGSFIGIIYDGPGEVEWEISDLNVMDFVPYHNADSGEDVLYYPDVTQVQLKIKKFGESTLTLKLNGEDVCSTLIKVILSDDTIVSRYKDQILNSSAITKLNEGKSASFKVLEKFSDKDQFKIAFMTAMDDYMGAGTLLKFVGSLTGLTTSQYEDYMDNTVNALIADYLSIDTSLSDVYDDFTKKADIIRAGINVGDSYGSSIKNDVIIQTLTEQTSFSRKQIESTFEIAGKVADSALELRQIGITTVMLAQFNMDVLQKLSETVSTIPGDCASDLYKSIKRTMKKVSDLDTYAIRIMASSHFKQFVFTIFEEWVKFSELTTVGLVLELGKFLSSWYKASGGIMADEYMASALSFNNAWVIYHAIENCKSSEELQFTYGFYISSVKVALKYVARLAEAKNMEKDISFHSELIQNGCSYEEMLKEVRDSIENKFVEEVTKTTSSGASAGNVSYMEDEIFMIPDDVDIKQYDIVSFDKETAKNIYDKNGIILPGTVRSIGAYAFSEYLDMEYICLGNQIETIEDSAFYGCDHLKFITIPEQTKTIGNNAFEKCSSIEYLVINADSVGDNVFKDCTALSEVRFNNKNTLIGNNAFDGCNSDLVITGYKNSTAEEYARKYSIKFETIPEYVSSLTILTPADKTSYTVEEEIDTSGLTVCAVYQDGTSETLTEGWIVAYNTMTSGNQKAYVIYGEKSVSFDISVNQENSAALKLDDTELKMICGTSRQIHAKTDHIQPILYISSDPDIAEVTASGYVKALNPGKVQITASIANTEISSVCEIEVSDKIEIPEKKYVMFTPPKDNYYLFVLSMDDRNSDIIIYDELKNEVSKDKTDDLHWSAPLEHDKIYTVKINGEIKSGDSIQMNEYTSQNNWQITNDKGEIISEIYAVIGDSFKLSCQPPKSNSTDSIYWESDDENIAIIDNNGNINCISEGDTTIRVRMSRYIAVKEISVHVVSKNNIEKTTNSPESNPESSDSQHSNDKTIAILTIIIIFMILAAVISLCFIVKKKSKKIMRKR